MEWTGRWLFKNNETNHRLSFCRQALFHSILVFHSKHNDLSEECKEEGCVDGHKCVSLPWHHHVGEKGENRKGAGEAVRAPGYQESLTRKNKEKARPFAVPALKTTLGRHQAEESLLATWRAQIITPEPRMGPRPRNLLTGAWARGPGVTTLGRAARTDERF